MGSFKYGHKRQGKPRTPLKCCGHSPAGSDVPNARCRDAGEQHLLALFGNKVQLKGEAGIRKRGERKCPLKAKHGGILSFSQGKKGLFRASQVRQGTRETSERRLKPPGVLAPEEEAFRDSPKAFLPADLLPVPNCHHTGAPTAGKLTSSV